MTQFEGKLHLYTPKLQAFEFAKSPQSATPKNTIIFIGGLGDSLLTVPYVPDVANALPSDWSLFQILITSSNNGWGTGSLDRDIEEIGELVEYLKGLGKEKIVLFGHSTGTQDSIHYLLKNGKGIDGIILQASASDREAIELLLKKSGAGDVEQWNKEAQEVFDKSGPNTILPQKYSDAFFGAPITAYRWLSLAVVGGDDDYFSSDLPDNRLRETFGELSKPALFLYSGSDEFVPPSIDKVGLLKKWESFTPKENWSKHSAVIEGATHNVNSKSKEGAREDLIKRVLAFLSDL